MGQVVKVDLVIPVVMDEPSLMPFGDDSQADVCVALGLLIESNWI